jgi:signal transduction histidine kinase
LSLVDELTRELRTMSHLLHPPMLDESGLGYALQWFIEGFSRRSNLSANFELDPQLGRLPREVETALFRIVQEWLTNFHRHSGSATADICLSRQGDEIQLTVRDHGRKERVRQLGGTFTIDSRVGETVVIVTIPVSVDSAQRSYAAEAEQDAVEATVKDIQ